MADPPYATVVRAEEVPPQARHTNYPQPFAAHVAGRQNVVLARCSASLISASI